MINDGLKYFNNIDIELLREDFNVLINHTSKVNVSEFLKPVKSTLNNELTQIEQDVVTGINLPFYRDLKIACGHFKTSQHVEVEMRFIADISHSYGKLNPDIHFVATASGNSMNGGKSPIEDGDLLLLERITPINAGSISGLIMAIETQDEAGDDQYLLRVVKKQANGSYLLIANNSDYPSMLANEEMNTFARLKVVLKDT